MHIDSIYSQETDRRPCVSNAHLCVVVSGWCVYICFDEHTGRLKKWIKKRKNGIMKQPLKSNAAGEADGDHSQDASVSRSASAAA